jgi:hypothetical protein
MSAHDPGGDGLGELLAPLAPDARRGERTRQVCRERLVRQGRRRKRTATIRARAIRAIAPLIVGAFCALYAAALVATTLQIGRVLP